MSHVVSVNVGLPKDISWRGKIVRTAIWKRPVEGRVMARQLNIDGDGQGDLQGHGGIHRAVMVYQLASYRYWEQVLQRTLGEYGMFGENLTVDDLPDDEVCIGDRYRIGGALFEVSQPRVTCYRVGIRMNESRMAALLVSHRRPGFYFRVVEEGEIGSGDEIVRIEQGHEKVTVVDADALLYLPEPSQERLRRAAMEPAFSPGWKQSFDALLANANGSTGNATLSPATPAIAWPGFRTLKVAAVVSESADVKSILLTAMDPPALAPPLAGSFIVIRVHAPNESGTITRSYSISNAGEDGVFRISVKRGTGDGSRFVNDSISVGDIIEASAPRGSFHLQPGDQPIVFLSAGIGITPVLSMLHQLAADRTESHRDLYWIYAARNGAEHPFRQEVSQLLNALPRVKSFVSYSQPRPIDQLGRDFDISQRISASLLQRLGVPTAAQFYVCGPPGFLTALMDGLKSIGVAPASIHTEIFGSITSLTPGIVPGPLKPPHAPEGEQGHGPTVSFIRSGLAVHWSDRVQNLLELAEACDVPVQWACRTGVCRTCMTALIEGQVSYDPSPLDAPSAGNTFICCARPTTDVELDL